METVVVSCVCWVPQGKAKENPKSYIHENDYIDGYESIEEEEQNEKEKKIEMVDSYPPDNLKEEENNDLKDLEIDKYDDENFSPGDQFFSKEFNDLLKDDKLQEIYDSEDEENKIYSSDFILINGTAEFDGCSLEICIYDENNESFFVHHDFIITSYPLCLLWLNECAHPDKKNVVAVGTFEPVIHIWDLDVLNKLDPLISLGMEKSTNLKKKKMQLSSSAHKAAVMSLDKNPLQNHILASGSADESVKLWDVNKVTCLHTYSHHEGKVQAVKWHNLESSILLSASFDKTVAMLDVRTPDTVAKFSLSSDAESALWDYSYPYLAIISTEDGRLFGQDVRCISANKKSFLFDFPAHSKALTCLANSPRVHGMLVSCSLDETAKVWDVRQTNENKELALVIEKQLKAGSLYNCCCNPDVGYIVAFGGKMPVIWNLSDNENCISRFNLPP